VAEIVCNGGDCSNDTVALGRLEYQELKNIAKSLGKEIVEVHYVVDEMENDECRIEIHFR